MKRLRNAEVMYVTYDHAVNESRAVVTLSIETRLALGGALLVGAERSQNPEQRLDLLKRANEYLNGLVID